ncbi:hypothetical protein ACOME3_003833 [Neoechinorhynchus agilis]
MKSWWLKRKKYDYILTVGQIELSIEQMIKKERSSSSVNVGHALRCLYDSLEILNSASRSSNLTGAYEQSVHDHAQRVLNQSLKSPLTLNLDDHNSVLIEKVIYATCECVSGPSSASFHLTEKLANLLVSLEPISTGNRIKVGIMNCYRRMYALSGKDDDETWDTCTDILSKLLGQSKDTISSELGFLSFIFESVLKEWNFSLFILSNDD